MKYDKITDIYDNVGGFNPPAKRIKKGKWGRSCYSCWASMVFRSFGPIFKKLNPTYKEVTMCNEFKDYYFFFDWFNENYYEVPGQRTALDKDILVPGNKVYSPEACVFLPACINTFISQTGVNNRIKLLKSGVYSLNIVIDGKLTNFGCYSSYDVALNMLKQIKKERLLALSKTFWDYLPQIVKDAIEAWEFIPDDTAKPSTQNLADNRVGERHQNKLGYWMEIIAYRSATDIDVRFLRWRTFCLTARCLPK